MTYDIRKYKGPLYSGPGPTEKKAVVAVPQWWVPSAVDSCFPFSSTPDKCCLLAHGQLNKQCHKVMNPPVTILIDCSVFVISGLLTPYSAPILTLEVFEMATR